MRLISFGCSRCLWNSYFSEVFRSCVGHHRKCCYRLFLDITLAVYIQHSQQTFDNCVKIRLESLTIHTRAKIDNCGSGMTMYPEIV